MSATLYFANEVKPKHFDFIEMEESINLSNSNTRFVLDLLGLDTDFEDCPAQKIEVLEEAVKDYFTSDRVDEGRETIELDNFIFCGIHAGYGEDKIFRIKKLLEQVKGKATHFYFA